MFLFMVSHYVWKQVMFKSYHCVYYSSDIQSCFSLYLHHWTEQNYFKLFCFSIGDPLVLNSFVLFIPYLFICLNASLVHLNHIINVFSDTFPVTFRCFFFLYLYINSHTAYRSFLQNTFTVQVEFIALPSNSVHYDLKTNLFFYWW